MTSRSSLGLNVALVPHLAAFHYISVHSIPPKSLKLANSRHSTSHFMNNETVSISRATSVSRASRHGSTISRSQSLIKKNIAPHDLRPSDILIERFVAWKAIVKQLIAYFEVNGKYARLLFLN